MRLFGLRLMRVEGHSMQPALSVGDCVRVNTQAYQRRLPRRGEIVAARPAACRGRVIVKRVAALPNEHITVSGSTWQLKEDECFLLGDSATESTDSRTFGPVALREVLGPVSRLGGVVGGQHSRSCV